MSEDQSTGRIRMDYNAAMPKLRQASREHGGKLSLNDVRAWICVTYGVKDDGGPNLTNRLRRLVEYVTETKQFRLEGTGRRKFIVPLDAGGDPENGAAPLPPQPAPSPVSGFQPPTPLMPAAGGGDVVERMLREQAEFRKLIAPLIQTIGGGPSIWDYKVVTVKDNGAGSIDYGEDDGPVDRLLARNFSIYKMLQRMGEAGWELIGMDTESYIFKRPKQS